MCIKLLFILHNAMTTKMLMYVLQSDLDNICVLCDINAFIESGLLKLLNSAVRQNFAHSLS